MSIAKVRKENVTAYLTRRGESEIIVEPELVTDRETFPLEES